MSRDTNFAFVAGVWATQCVNIAVSAFGFNCKNLFPTSIWHQSPIDKIFFTFSIWLCLLNVHTQSTNYYYIDQVDVCLSVCLINNLAIRFFHKSISDFNNFQFVLHDQKISFLLFLVVCLYFVLLYHKNHHKRAWSMVLHINDVDENIGK